MDGKGLSQGIVYQATVSTQDGSNVETYVGLTDTTFKLRYNVHKSSFKNKHIKSNTTTLSSYVWDLKDSSKNYDIKWKIIGKAKSYNPASKECNLCTREKYFIIYHPELASLNNRNELISKCRHRRKFILENT